MVIKSPTIIDNILSQEDFLLLKNHAKDLSKNKENFEEGFGRHVHGGTEILNKIHKILSIKAKDFFESKYLQPSFSMISIYSGDKASLYRHKDDNACTYHFDLCIFQNEPWDIWVEHEGVSKPYTLYENQALAMYGNIQEHWRDPLPNPENNIVCNAFFFFCEPDHWYFTEGPEYLNVIRENNKVR
jgi:hypothetical protein